MAAGISKAATESQTDRWKSPGGAAQTLDATCETFDTPEKTGKNAHARVECTGARKIVFIARSGTVYLVGMFRVADYDDTNQQARNASGTA